MSKRAVSPEPAVLDKRPRLERPSVHLFLGLKSGHEDYTGVYRWLFDPASTPDGAVIVAILRDFFKNIYPTIHADNGDNPSEVIHRVLDFFAKNTPLVARPEKETTKAARYAWKMQEKYITSEMRAIQNRGTWPELGEDDGAVSGEDLLFLTGILSVTTFDMPFEI